MSGAWLEYNGVKTDDLYLKIVNDMQFTSAEDDIDFIPVPGKDGEVAIDKQRKKGIDFPIPVQLKLPKGTNVISHVPKITKAYKTKKWGVLKISTDPDYYYMAMMFQRFDVAETLKTFGKSVLNFKLKPFKYHVSGEDYITVTQNKTITNNFDFDSKPLIQVTGTGDVTLQKNGKDWLILTGLDGTTVYIDSEAKVVYDSNMLAQNKKMNAGLRPMFPLLDESENTITWTGLATSVKIKPRWEVKL